VVVDPGDGLSIQESDGTQTSAQSGQTLVAGDRLVTDEPAGQGPIGRPATIKWLDGGTSQIYDAKPRIFVAGHGSAVGEQTTAVIEADPTPRVTVLGGFLRFWFGAGEARRFSFGASTDVVSTATTGTDFTIGHDPSTNTSTIGVTEDSVTVTPVNPTLRPFSLAAGSQVSVSNHRIGPITGLADQTAAQRGHSAPAKSGVPYWLIGLTAALVLAIAASVLVIVARRKRFRLTVGEDGSPATTVVSDPVLVTARLQSVDSLASVGAGHRITGTDPHGLPVISSPPTPPSDWRPTHRVPAEGMPARAIPDEGARDLAILPGGTGIRIVERRGEWANVAAPGGWSGWVRARQLAD
jgi:hypothetical protein